MDVTQLLNERASGAQSSAIRDLLDQARRPGMISLAGGLPDSTMFPVEELADIAGAVLRRNGATVLQYGVTRGEESARSALASQFDDVSAEDLVITTGSQQGLDLVARVLFDPGDSVVIGDPEYLGVLQIFRGVGATLCPIAIDGDGLDTEALERRLVTGLRPKACYLVPHFHNPSGVTMSPERRRHLHQLSEHYGFVVIEDDPYRQLFYDGVPPAEAGGNPELTVRFRSASKVLTPGLRIGAMAAPRWLGDAVITAKQSADLHTSTVTQAIVAEALTAPWFPDHLASLRSVYGAKRDELLEQLRAAFGDQVVSVAPAGGMFLWATFSEEVDTAAWLTRALDAGVCFVPGAAFAVERTLDHTARFSFVTASTEQLAEAVARLAASYEAS